jgi:hypothetical protein
MAKTIPSALKPALYQFYNEPLELFELYTDPGQASPTHRYVNNNESIVFDSHTYHPLAIKRSAIKSEEGTIINDLEVGLDNVDLAFLALVANGGLSRRRIVIKLVFNGFLSSSSNYILIVDGHLDEPKGDDHWVTMSIKPYPVFEREFPRRLFQVPCNWRFGDDNCGINLASYAHTGTIGSGSTASVINISTGQSTNYYVPGYIVITEAGHDLYGVARPIIGSDSSTVTLRVQFDSAPPSGIACKVQKLCGKTEGACKNDFSNWANYGGFPFVPLKPIL